jgi:hypothetical protein
MIDLAFNISDIILNVSFRFLPECMPLAYLLSFGTAMSVSTKNSTILSFFDRGLMLWCLTPHSTIYRDGQFYWWRKPEGRQVTPLRHIILNPSQPVFALQVLLVEQELKILMEHLSKFMVSIGILRFHL